MGFWKELDDQMQEGATKDRFGKINPVLVCPHCQTKGKVRAKRIEQKTGVSGGKATAAVLTGGLSLLAVGLSRKEQHTQLYCGNCTSLWLV